MSTFIKRRLLRWLGLAVSLCISAWAAEPSVLKVTFNGLDITIDRKAGSLLELYSSATGVMLKAPAEKAGLVDVAYPIEAFLPMRLATRFSRAEVAQEKNQVVITWKALGPSRNNIPLPDGQILARVTIRPTDDGRSVIMTCRIENKSAVPIPQVLFPDLWGLKPFAGVEQTRLRLARGIEQPFKEPFKDPESAPVYMDRGVRIYNPTGYYGENALRWLDLGGFEGGLSIFQKKWGSEDRPEVITQRSELDPLSLRLALEHKQTIEPGQSWESGEMWLTPHPGGWAKGIEVYRQYVQEVNPPRPLPSHVRDGLGFQTITLTEDFESEPAKAYFRFVDLPQVAKDAAQYGINEVVFWADSPSFELPIPLYRSLGTREEFVQGIQQAKNLGVNMVPFVSVHEILTRDAERLYGVKPSMSDLQRNWTYHSGLIPNFRAYYAKGYESIWIPSNNPRWLKGVWDELAGYIHHGVYSFSWDEFAELTFDEFGQAKVDSAKTDLINLIDRVRDLARAKDAESTFSGESSNADSLEVDGKVLDYTWNWVDYVDAGPILNVLRAPRLNCNVEDSAKVVKKAFIDGLYINLMPRKLGESNGSALISSQPEMARALKQVAALRKQFLPFFVDGTFIGDSVLSKPASAFVRGYTLDKKVLIFVLNDRDKAAKLSVSGDLSLWMPSGQSYVSKYFHSDGKLIRTTPVAAHLWSDNTELLQPNELMVFEIEER